VATFQVPAVCDKIHTGGHSKNFTEGKVVVPVVFGCDYLVSNRQRKWLFSLPFPRMLHEEVSSRKVQLYTTVS